MMRLRLITAMMIMGALMATDTKGEALKVGEDAPAFSLKGSDGKTYRLADFKGKQAVVIAWYPKAFTGG